MRYLIIFRGHHSLKENRKGIAHSGIVDPKFVCNNIQRYILEPLKSNNNVDIMFSTYNSNLENLKIFQSYLSPIKTFFTNNGQIINFKETLGLLSNIYDTYDHIIFLRFDIIYKKNILEWNFFDKEGIIYPFKEESLEESHSLTRYYGDAIIIVSKSWFLNVSECIIKCHISEFIPEGGFHNTPFLIQKSFPHIKIHTIVEGYYQSYTGLELGNPRINPIFIQVRYNYYQSDKAYYFNE